MVYPSLFLNFLMIISLAWASFFHLLICSLSIWYTSSFWYALLYLCQSWEVYSSILCIVDQSIMDYRRLFQDFSYFSYAYRDFYFRLEWVCRPQFWAQYDLFIYCWCFSANCLYLDTWFIRPYSQHTVLKMSLHPPFLLICIFRLYRVFIIFYQLVAMLCCIWYRRFRFLINKFL